MKNLLKIILALVLSISLTTVFCACKDKVNQDEYIYETSESTEDSTADSSGTTADDGSNTETAGESDTESDTDRHYNGIQGF